MRRGYLVRGVWVVCAALLLAMSEGGLPAAAADESSCVTCHAQLDGQQQEPAKTWASDLHAAAGLSCVSCHGGDPSPAVAGDPEAAMDPAKGFRPKPDRLHVPEFCARCHSDAAFMKQFNPQARVDQMAEYRTSVHGVKNSEGDVSTAVCTDCHGVHGMRNVASPDSPVYAMNVPRTCGRCHADSVRMAPYGIRTDQLERYTRSVHGIALLERSDVAAPACNDCHGNHGAAPPGVQSVAHVCGQCHGREAVLFNASFKKELFESTGAGECTVCHDHHEIDHPTPELFHSGSAPETSQGDVLETSPFSAELGDLPEAEKARATWRVTLRPRMPVDDRRLEHRIEVSSEGGAPLVLDATIRPGDVTPVVRKAASEQGGLSATLSIDAPAGGPIEDGDALVLELEVSAGASAARAVKIHDLPGEGVRPVVGSACLNCHSKGDSCEVATDRMYDAALSLERNLRAARNLLHRAEVAGMEVSGPLFELKSQGTTAAVETRALIHAFDTDRLLARAAEGEKVPDKALQAGRAALAELQTRRKGLGISLVFVAFVLVGLALKIRQVDRAHRATIGEV